MKMIKALAACALVGSLTIQMLGCSRKGVEHWNQPYELKELIQMAVISLLDSAHPPQGTQLNLVRNIEIRTAFLNRNPKEPFAEVNILIGAPVVPIRWLESSFGAINFYSNFNYQGITHGSGRNVNSQTLPINYNFYYAPDDLPGEIIRHANSYSIGFDQNGFTTHPFSYRPWSGQPEFTGTYPGANRAYGYPPFPLQNQMLPYHINTPRMLVKPNFRDWQTGVVWHAGRRYGEYTVSNFRPTTSNSSADKLYLATVELEIYAFPR